MQQQDLDQVVQAILIASDPSEANLHQQALQYLSTIQENANTTWRLALSLFVELTAAGTRKYPSQARFFALRVLEEFFDNRFEPLEGDSFRTLQQSLISYIQSEYVYGSAEAHAPFLRNKLSHTLTLFFLCTYIDQWPTFFTDLFALIRPAEPSSQITFNRHVSLLFFHLVLEISGEVADQVIKSARSFSQARHTRDARVRDAVRERDAASINEAVLTIVADSADRMANLRKVEASAEATQELDGVIEVVDWGIRTFASYVGWIDINLTVTPSTIPLLFSLLSDPSLPIRLATCTTLLRIVSKGLKEPGDKLQLIKVLSLGQVVDALEAKTLLQQRERGEAVDEGEESYREALGKLLNILGLELAKLTEDCTDEEINAEATRHLNQILPVLLRFLADEYDDTSSTVFPLLQNILTSYKRTRKVAIEPLDTEKRTFLASLLKVLVEKSKWDSSEDPADLDEDDKAAFDGIRKELRTFMDSIRVIEQELVTNFVHALAMNILSAYRSGAPVPWNEAELAIYLVYIYGEINKSGGKGRPSFCQVPVAKDKRRETDYSEYPLTTLGEMLLALVQSGISSYPHRTVVMQFFETVARYCDFFKVRKECILPTLEAMIDPRGIHNQDTSVRSRVSYLFHRFVKEVKNDLPIGIVVNVLEGIRDLLQIEVEIPEMEGDATQTELLAEAAEKPGIFDPQLYLYETVGILASLLGKNPEQQASVLLSVVEPLLEDLSVCLETTAKGSPEVATILRVHHIIMALGNIAKGFPEHPAAASESYVQPAPEVFARVAQAILVSLERMNVFKVVRDAARFAFARILATAGAKVTQFIPPLMVSLLVHFEPAELADFMGFISLLIHKLQKDVFDVLDELIGPLSTHITQFLSQPVTGTDDGVVRADTKRAYLTLLNSIMSSKLQDVFISDRNKAVFEPLLESMERLAEDTSDAQSEKAAFIFLRHCVNVWGQPLEGTPSTSNRPAEAPSQGLPGFERFIYERLVPAAFRVPSSPQFNLKDGQVLVVLYEIANFLQAVCHTRGAEAYHYLLSVFLPSQNWPQETALEFTTKLRDLDGKNFRKYFTDVVRASRSGS